MNAARELLTQAMQPLAVGLSLPEKEKFAWCIKTRQDGEANPGVHAENLPEGMVIILHDFLVKTVGVQAVLSEKKLEIYIKQDLLPRQGLPSKLPGLLQQYANSYQSPLRYRLDLAEKLWKLDRLLNQYDTKGHNYPEWTVHASTGEEAGLNFRLQMGRKAAPGFEERGRDLIRFYKKCGIMSNVLGEGHNGFLHIYGEENIASIMTASPPYSRIYRPSPAHGPQKLLTYAQS